MSVLVPGSFRVRAGARRPRRNGCAPAGVQPEVKDRPSARWEVGSAIKELPRKRVKRLERLRVDVAADAPHSAAARKEGRGLDAWFTKVDPQEKSRGGGCACAGMLSWLMGQAAIRTHAMRAHMQEAVVLFAGESSRTGGGEGAKQQRLVQAG
eukprot:362851-Chlamydomonas_euryale.AAC.1